MRLEMPVCLAYAFGAADGKSMHASKSGSAANEWT